MNASIRILTTLAVLCAALTLGGPAATAADPTTGDSLSFPLGKKGSGLRVKGVKVRAMKPSRLVGATVSLPVSDVSLPRNGEGQVVLRGGFKLIAGRRSIAIQGLLVKLSGSKVTVTGKAGSARFQLFTGRAGASNIDPARTAVKFDATQLKPSKRLVKSLRKALNSKRFRVSSLGGIKGGSTAYFPPLVPNPIGPTQDPWEEPALPERPVTAADVTTATALDWWSRVSWVNYVGQPAQLTGVTPLGATNTCSEPLGPNGVQYNNGFQYPFTTPGSWWDAASQTGVLRYSGSVRFYYPDRFDMSFADPEVVIRPTGWTMNMRVVTASYPTGKRAEVFKLIESGGTQYHQLTKDGADGVFGGMYPLNDGFGCSIIGFTAP